MLRSIFLLVAIAQCCRSFAPPHQPHLADGVAPPLGRGAHHDIGATGTSSVLSRMRSRKALYAHLDFDDSSDDSKPTVMAGVGEYNPEEKLGLEREAANVGDPQVAQMEPMNITKVLTELQAIQSQGPKKYCILGTRHCSFLHQQIVEML